MVMVPLGANTSVKVAITVWAAFIITVHWLPFVLSHPAHPLKTDPEGASGVAVRVTDVPWLWVSQPLPQAMPEGLLVTVPDPVPVAVVTVSMYLL